MNFLIFYVLLLAPLWGEEKKPAEKPTEKICCGKYSVKPEASKEEKPRVYTRNIRQYDFDTYCKLGFYYFDHPEKMVQYYSSAFRDMPVDVAMSQVQKNALQKLLTSQCEW